MCFMGFPCGSAGKEFACTAGDLGSIRGLGGSPRRRERLPTPYSGLKNPMDCIAHGVAKSWTRPSNLHFTSVPFQEDMCTLFCLYLSLELLLFPALKIPRLEQTNDVWLKRKKGDEWERKPLGRMKG